MAITLTAAEENLRSFLIDLARKADRQEPLAATVTYAETAQACDPLHKPADRHHARTVKMLFHVVSHELEHGRPMLTALVVRGDTEWAGDGFALVARRDRGDKIGTTVVQEKEFWRAELDRVIAYWQSADPEVASVQDAQFEAIMSELRAIRKMLRKLLHGAAGTEG